MGRECGRGLPAQAAMWPLLVVFTAPQVEDDSGLGQAQKQFPVQQFIRQAADKALYISILPRTGFLNVQGADCGLGQLLLYFLGDELRTIGTADVLRRAAHSKHILQRQGHVAGRERAGDLNRRAFPSVLIDYGEQPNLSSVVGSIGRKVIAPNMIVVLRTMPDAAALAAAGPPPPFPLFGRDRQLPTLPSVAEQSERRCAVHCPENYFRPIGERIDSLVFPSPDYGKVTEDFKVDGVWPPAFPTVSLLAMDLTGAK